MKITLIILAVILAVIGIYLIVAGRYDTFSDKAALKELANEAMQKVGIEQVGWKTALVASVIEIDASPEDVWAYWSQIDRWPEWSGSLHKSVSFTSEPSWEVGHTFDQTLDLGMAGTIVGHETIKYADPAHKTMWWKDDGGVRSCHIWVFEPIEGGRSRVTNLEVFDGTLIGVMKPLLIPDWQRKFDAGLEALASKLGSDSDS